MISPVLLSSLRKTGHPLPSVLTSINSNFVPMILYVDLSGSMGPYRSTVLVYLLLSNVGKSSSRVVDDLKSTFARDLSIFLRYKLAITLEGV